MDDERCPKCEWEGDLNVGLCHLCCLAEIAALGIVLDGLGVPEDVIERATDHALEQVVEGEKPR